MSEYNKLINDINNRNFLPVYLIHGDENYFSDQIINLLVSNVINKDSADFDLKKIYGKNNMKKKKVRL